VKKILSLLLCMVTVVSIAAEPLKKAVYAGNYTAVFRKAFAGILQDAGTFKELKFPAEKADVIVFAWRGKYVGAKPDSADIEKMRQFLVDGGIIIFMSATQNEFFAQKRSLASGADILGAAYYSYSKTKELPSETAKKLFGASVEKANVYANSKSNHAGLAKVTSMIRLYGGANFIELGVNRVGKGAVVFTSAPPADAEYCKIIVKLVETLLDPAAKEKFFPAPASNAAVTVNGKIRHLTTVSGGNHAATEFFRDVMSRTTGKSNFSPLPGGDEYFVHIGETDYVKSLNPDLSSLHPFGYLIFCRDGKNLVITGKNKIAVFYGVNDFLKRFAGYRKFANTPYFEVISGRKTLELPEKIDIREEPVVGSYLLAKTPNNAFGRNGRLNCMATHALSSLVPVEKYHETHPEYFPVINGKRKKMIPGKNNGPWNPCISHADIPKLVEEYADDYFKRYPERTGLPMGVNDGGGDCQCDKCAKVLRETGNQYVEFYNTAARVLAKKYPDKLLCFIAYSRNCSKVPTGVRMEPNILVEVTGMGISAFQEIPKWEAVGIRHFGLYDYIYPIGTSFIMPRYYPRVMGRLWMKAIQEKQLKSIWAEYFPGSVIFEAPRQYVLDNIAWYGKVDIDALLDDYFVTMYGDAAKAVKELFDIFEDVYSRKPYADIPIHDRMKLYQFKEFTRNDIVRMDKAMDKALKAHVSPLIRHKLNILHKLFIMVRCNIENAVCAQELADMKIDSDAALERVLYLMNSGYAAIEKFRNFPVTPEEEKDMFVEPAKFGIRKFKNISTLNPATYLERHLDPALERVTAYLSAKGKNIREFYLDAADKTPFKAARAILLTQVYMRENKSVNLVRNPGFEDEKSRRDKGLFADHQGFGSVDFWHKYSFPNSKTEFLLLDKGANSGKKAVAIGERQYRACIISYVRLEPGCRYRLSFYVKRNRGDEGYGFGEATVRMQANGKWLDSGSATVITYPPECENKWVKVGTVFSAPDIPATLLILLGAPRQSEGAYTAFDDVALEKIYDPAAFDFKKKSKLSFSGDISGIQTKTAVLTANELTAGCEKFLPALQVVLENEKIADNGTFRADSSVPGKVVIYGDDEALRCGIYTLLNVLGIHWFSPQEDAVLPQTPAVFDREKFHGVFQPDFPYRGLHICGKGHFDDRVARWMSFNRMNRKLTHLPEDDVVGSRLKELGLRPDTTVHAYSLLIPDEKYYSSVPEFFALLGGKRIPQKKGGQLCLSNKAMRKVFADELLAQIKARPHIGVFGFPPNDGYGHCECDACMALDSPDERSKRLVNGRIADFVADICAQMSEKAPGVMLGHYSYSNFADFMDHLPAAPENLLVSVTQFHCHKHGIADPVCPVNRADFARLKKVRSKVRHVYIYDYFTYKLGKMPAPFMRSIFADFKLYRDLKLDGWLSECEAHTSETWEAQWLNFYSAARLLWNTSVRQDEFLKEVCRIRYGKAEKFMYDYFNTLENAVASSGGCLLKKPEEFAGYFTSALSQKLESLLIQAENAAPGNVAVASERKLFDFWKENAVLRKKYTSAMNFTLPRYSATLTAQPFFFVNGSSQLPDLQNPSEIKLFDGGDHLRIIFTAHETRMKTLKTAPANVYGGDCLELFLDDGINPRKCYHFLISPEGRVAASECEGRRWNWSWKHNAAVTGVKKADRWEVDIKIPYKDFNAGRSFGFTAVRNRCASGRTEITGTPAGGAYFKTDGYIRCSRAE